MISINALAAWIITVVARWTPAAVPHVAPEELAPDIAAVVADEGPIWFSRERVISPQREAEKTSAVMASLAYWEGARFARYVDQLDCNRWMHQKPSERSAEARRLLAFGDCMGGIGYSMWQVIPIRWTEGQRVEDFTPERLGVRKEAIRAAYLQARMSFHVRGDLSLYTGEPKDDHPKADIREAFARRFW